PAPAPRNARLFDDGCRGSAPPHKTTASRGRRAAFAPVQHGALARFASAKGLSSARSLHLSSPVRSLAAIVPSYHSSFSEPQTRNPPTTNPFHERKFHGIDRLGIHGLIRVSGPSGLAVCAQTGVSGMRIYYDVFELA